jgi:hypothetical protein
MGKFSAVLCASSAFFAVRLCSLNAEKRKEGSEDRRDTKTGIDTDMRMYMV